MKTIRLLLLPILLTVVAMSCDDFVTVEPPVTQLVRSTVFSDDATAEAAMLGLYNQLAFTGCASGDGSSISFLTSLSSDEQISYNTTGFSSQLRQFNENGLTPTGSRLTGLWSQPYQFIYKANDILEGVMASASIREDLKKRLVAEAKFMRAFGHFYLLNLFGDVPLILMTDWQTNSLMTRTPEEEIYGQIIKDLNDARADLPDSYTIYGGERARLTKYAATAFLAKVYLYRQDWQKAEELATEVLANQALYALEQSLANVFLMNSKEAIWQLARPNANAADAALYTSNTTPRNAALSPTLIAAFEPLDQRFTTWLKRTTSGGNTYYQPAKYKATSTVITEYTTLFRVAEQHLIRAEARANLENLTLAIADLDAVRFRAGLPLIQNTNPGISRADLLTTIMHERQVELFTEWGHRWFDLKRTNRIDEVMAPVKPGWQATDKLYPIPQSQIQSNPNMSDSQNPGY